jgi:membrane-bound lytic murein transglycosylase D
MRIRWILVLVAGCVVAEADPTPTPAAVSSDDLYGIGKQLFDQYASPEVKGQYEFPSKSQWDEFAARLQGALDDNSLEELSKYEAEARAALLAAQTFPGFQDNTDWLALRVDEIEAAAQAAKPAADELPGPPQTHHRQSIPYYELWTQRVKDRPVPANASALMPRLRAAFVAGGVPSELAWLAEAESSLNPKARSPAGAAGLFQFTPDTAKAVGLRTFLPDERTDPEASARAAARLLHLLYAKFGSWPLALSAYNAGEGRVTRLLESKGATSFAGIEAGLPAETRMYVPKVFALIALRTGITPDELPPPSA